MCTFCVTVWRKLLLYLNEHHGPQQWNAEVEWTMTKGMGKSFSSRLRRLCFAAAIYHIWAARNTTIFYGK
ncbi:hypothetical protein LIER_03728 [Lithospermum erythrorhizon]|uniref:Reverse transcriptase n=1 Tax=Lithospermum erythrorhizon TaxID=34254 RepID=A0AAV3NUY8_LITER